MRTRRFGGLERENEAAKEALRRANERLAELGAAPIDLVLGDESGSGIRGARRRPPDGGVCGRSSAAETRTTSTADTTAPRDDFLRFTFVSKLNS